MQEPKIEYPCDYPIKVIGESSPDFLGDVLTIVQKYDSTMVLDKVKERASRVGNYKSVTLLFWATSEQQIKDVFAELKTCEAVRLVL
jgi:putative lipoic acid-binding regulatory protein|tara:strand:- start:430 stop:690 length:261 start_codon:yes stop_codon:yes gene_type:complete